MDSTVRADLNGHGPAQRSDPEAVLIQRAPELGMALIGRATPSDAQAELRAQLTRATIFNRLARKADAAGQAAPALRRAEQLGAADLARALRVELARAALEAGPPTLALALLDPVLASPGPPLGRAVALVVAAEALAACGHADGAIEALTIADRLCDGERLDGDGIGADDGLLLRGAVCTVRARQHRREGSPSAAAAQARAGLGLLAVLVDSDRDSGEVRGELVLELVLALLDDGATEDATRAAVPLLDRPPRAASAASAAWAALAVATRVHLPRGNHERALGLLTDTVRVAERHRLESVLVGCRDALVLIHEDRGELTEALEHLREARAAEHRRRRAVDTVRAAAEESVPPVGERSHAPDRVAALLHRQVTEAVGSRHHPDAAGQVPAADRPPPAPEMRRLEGADVSAVVLGDLLAEALPAFQNGHHHPPREHADGPPTIAGAVRPDPAEQLWRPPPRTRRRAVGG